MHSSLYHFSFNVRVYSSVPTTDPNMGYCSLFMMFGKADSTVSSEHIRCLIMSDICNKISISAYQLMTSVSYVFFGHVKFSHCGYMYIKVQ